MNSPPSIGELPGSVADEICLILDSSTDHNWINLLEHVPEYTHMDMIELRNLAQLVGKIVSSCHASVCIPLVLYPHQ